MRPAVRRARRDAHPAHRIRQIVLTRSCGELPGHRMTFRRSRMVALPVSVMRIHGVPCVPKTRETAPAVVRSCSKRAPFIAVGPLFLRARPATPARVPLRPATGQWTAAFSTPYQRSGRTTSLAIAQRGQMTSRRMLWR